jgi:hypothetical protein
MQGGDDGKDNMHNCNSGRNKIEILIGNQFYCLIVVNIIIFTTTV